MIVKNPYQLLNRDNKAYTIPNNWLIKSAQSTKVKTLEGSIKNCFGKEKGQDKESIASLWEAAYVPFDKSMLQNSLTSNVLIALKDVSIYEYFGQRDALEECRHDALIKLSKGFDWKQFEPIKIANIKGELYCYDGGGRGHIVHAAGFQFIPCSIVKLDSLSDLRVLFMEQKKLTKTISLNTKYVQSLAVIQDSITKDPISWWKDLNTDQKLWYNVFKLLQCSNLQVDGKDFAALGGLRKAYASFVISNGNKSPTSRGKGDSDPNIECPSLVSALNTYRSFLVSNSLQEKMQCSIACYLGQIIRKLYDPKNGVSMGFAAKITNDALTLAHNKYLKQNKFKTFAAFFSAEMGDFKGEQPWKKYDRKLGGKVTSDYSWFGRLVWRSIHTYPCKVQQQAFHDALARNKHIR